MTLNNNSPTDNLIREKWVDAPERIWAFREGRMWKYDFAQTNPHHMATDYVREDIHRAQADRDRARIEALEGALSAADEAVAEYGNRQANTSGKESRDWQTMKMAALDIQQEMARRIAALANTASDN